MPILTDLPHPLLEIIRIEETTEGTLGVMRINGSVFCCTLEPPDNENARNTSSIPAQQYTVIRHQSPRYGEVFKITGVPGRSEVLIHAGNVVNHTKGCVLLGSSFGKLSGNKAILNSGATLRAFMSIFNTYDTLKLTIKEIY